jgi:hypothetical protein
LKLRLATLECTVLPIWSNCTHFRSMKSCTVHPVQIERHEE